MDSSVLAGITLTGGGAHGVRGNESNQQTMGMEWMRSASMCSLRLSPFTLHSLTTCRVHILHCVAAGQLVTRQSLNLQCCYTDLGTGRWWGRMYTPVQASYRPSARQRGTAHACRSSPGRRCPAQCHLPDNHPYRRLPCRH